MNQNKDKWYIVKPSCAAQGRGIWFTNNFNDIPFKQDLVVSHYINNPYLINGYKFDLRIYVLITSVNPLMVYVFEEGLARFATSKYTPLTSKNNMNKFTHLTNYSVNKKNANFIKNEDASDEATGSKWTLNALWKHFKKEGIDPKIIK